MRHELYEELRKDFPNILYKFFTCECGDGWFELIYQLFKDIKRIVDNTPDNSLADFRILLIKEKFGSLRVYTCAANDQIHKLISEAEKKSMETCEVCGRRGSLSIKRSCYKTVCSYHREELGFIQVRPEGSKS